MLSAQTRKHIAGRLDEVARVTLADVRRVARLALTDAGSEVLVVHVSLAGGSTEVIDDGPPVEQTLGVTIPLDAARAIGGGTELLDDVYDRGELALTRSAPEDFRLAPLLELLLEELADAGALSGEPGAPC